MDLERALTYPLSPIPLSIATGDGNRRTTAKSKLLKAIHPEDTDVPLPDMETVSDYIVDLMALVRTQTAIPKTFAEFFWKLIISIPRGYKSVHIVADSYREVSMKNAERTNRGNGSKIFVKSPVSNIPRDFQQFLKNGENKMRLIDLFFMFIEDNKLQVLNDRKCTRMVLSKDGLCTVVSQQQSIEDPNLTSNQEEADTKVILHCEKSLSSNNGANVILSSLSGDTDIIVIAVALLRPYRERVFIESGSGKNKHRFWLKDISVTNEQATAIIGMHAFSGNDFVSSFFRKGK